MITIISILSWKYATQDVGDEQETIEYISGTLNYGCVFYPFSTMQSKTKRRYFWFCLVQAQEKRNVCKYFILLNLIHQINLYRFENKPPCFSTILAFKFKTYRENTRSLLNDTVYFVILQTIFVSIIVQFKNESSMKYIWGESMSFTYIISDINEILWLVYMTFLCFFSFEGHHLSQTFFF